MNIGVHIIWLLDIKELVLIINSVVIILSQPEWDCSVSTYIPEVEYELFPIVKTLPLQSEIICVFWTLDPTIKLVAIILSQPLFDNKES